MERMIGKRMQRKRGSTDGPQKNQGRERMPAKVIFCYAHEDEALLNQLKTQLKPLERQGLIELWYDRDIRAGTPWEHEISQRLNTAQIILLLISPDFLNSEYCYEIEMKRALERHQRGEAHVVPVILRPVYWQGVLGHLQALPKDARPITDPEWHNQDRALHSVAEGLHKLVADLASPPITKEKDRTSKHILSRRNMIVGMTGLFAATGGIIWFSLSREGNGSHLISGVTPPASSRVLTCNQGFSDDFTTSYDKRWQWMSEGDATIQVTNGALAITTPVGHDLYVGKTNAPKLLQSLPEKLMMETYLKFAPIHTYQGAGLLIWQDEKNFVRLERGYGDVGAIIFEKEINGSHEKMSGPFSGDGKPIPTTADQVILRLQRDGNQVNAWWQDVAAKTSWQVVGSTTFTFSASAQIGLAVVNQPQGSGTDPGSTPITAYFDYVHVTC